ncbi:MAG: sulfur reduction protein DsrS [Pseudomonadota bacterium]
MNSDPRNELSPEDALRLNVLLAGELLAVRLDEGARTLYALTPKGEARIPLNPVGRAERYFQRVRELLGGHALNSPGGYPVHLRRWTRMGQASEKNLEALLKLGASEAVMAVACAAGLTDELARRVWWASQNLATMEVARVMLMHPAVRIGSMGPVLADYLIEHLPFEEDPIAAMQSVRAVLAAGLLAPGLREQLWAKGKRRPYYLIGFLESLPDDLPPEAPRALPAGLPDTPAARLLARCYSGAGQSYLKTAELTLEKPPAHEAVYLLLDLLGGYFAAGREAGDLPLPSAEIAALEALGRLSNVDAEPILTRTTAVGPLLRRHLEPLFAPIIAHIQVLRGLP